MKYFSSLCLVLLIAVSCNKNDDGVMPVTTMSELLIKTVNTDGEITESFQYDAENRLITRNGTYELGAIRIEIVYQDNLIVYNYFNNQNVKVKAINNYLEQNINVRQVDIDVDTGAELGYRLYTTNTTTCNLESIGYYTSENVQFLTVGFEYTDENCSTNVTLIDDNPDNRARNNTINDNRNRAIKSLDYPFFNTVFSHNRVTYTNYREDNTIIAETSYINAYTYNQFDYPTTESRTYLDSRTIIFTYEYF
ncbi:MAG: hypothetical protein ACI849_000729 [Patiriisocius sp.]|jgi:hypothetical protein